MSQPTVRSARVSAPEADLAAEPPTDPGAATEAPRGPRVDLRRRVAGITVLLVLLTLGASVLSHRTQQPAAPLPSQPTLSTDPSAQLAVTAAPEVPSAVASAVRQTAPVAWGRVLAVWTGPVAASPRIQLVTGSTALATAAGQPSGGADGLVAITTADRVYVDVTAYGRLAPAGQLAVLTHELTHLAAGAAADPTVPVWLEEGFADYVGFLGTGIDIQTAGQAAIEQVRRHGPVTALPSDHDFTAGSSNQAAAYAESWLMCRQLAQQYGQASLVTLYQQVAHGRTTIEKAVQQVTGHPMSEAVTAWSDTLNELAR